MLYLKLVITYVHLNVQDCAGVILCAAERATQVALQVKEHQTDSFLVLFMNLRTLCLDEYCVSVLLCSSIPLFPWLSRNDNSDIQGKFYSHLNNVCGLCLAA